MKKQPKPWLIFSGLFFQIAIVMFVLTRLGSYADSYFQKERIKSVYTNIIFTWYNSNYLSYNFSDKKFKITF